MITTIKKELKILRLRIKTVAQVFDPPSIHFASPRRRSSATNKEIFM